MGTNLNNRYLNFWKASWYKRILNSYEEMPLLVKSVINNQNFMFNWKDSPDLYQNLNCL